MPDGVDKYGKYDHTQNAKNSHRLGTSAESQPDYKKGFQGSFDNDFRGVQIANEICAHILQCCVVSCFLAARGCVGSDKEVGAIHNRGSWQPPSVHLFKDYSRNKENKTVGWKNEKKQKKKQI